MANMAATAAMTGEDNWNQLTTYRARVTAKPVFSILAPNVTSHSSCCLQSKLLVIFTRNDKKQLIMVNTKR